MKNDKKPTKTFNEKVNQERFEFILYINENIVCQRYFDIFHYKEEFTNSLELKEMMDEIAGMNNGGLGSLGIIPNHLKKQSMDMLWEKYNPFFIPTNQYKGNGNRKDMFYFEFIVDKKVVCKTEFPNEFYNLIPGLEINIRGIIPEIISEIRYSSSRKKYLKAS